jgi:hypothetical protein
MTRTLLLGLLTVVALALAPAAPAAAASAGTDTSSNWSGYVAHERGLRFRYVTASWTQPRAACSAGSASDSSVWVGLGGYKLGSDALEQIGTELDCRASGRASSSAWYELVPAASRTIHLTIRPGDRIQASVRVIGPRVTVTLADRTTHRSFSKTVRDPSADVGSADWIVEAPSECVDLNSCETLPLADFGSVRIVGASANTAGGRHGSIASRMWRTTKITLKAGGRQYATFGQYGTATPSALADAGTAFEVDYAQSSARPPLFNAARAQPGGARSG